MTGTELDRYIALYRNSVISAALCVVRDPADADDIAQEVFLGLYTSEKSFRDDEHVKAWLLRCAVNRSIDLKRSKWHRDRVSFEALGDAIGETRAAEPESREELTDALSRLDKKLRIALYLCYYEGYTAKQAARSVPAVRWRLARGKAALRELLTDERNGDNND